MYANRLRKHTFISKFPASLSHQGELLRPGTKAVFSSWQTEADLTAGKISALCPPPEAESIFQLQKLSPTLPFQKLRPHSPPHKLKIPLLHLEAKFPPHALLARSTHPLMEAEPQFWLQRSPDATQTTSCFSHLSRSLLLHPEARSSELSLEVRSTPLLLEAESGLWLHRQSLALTWEAEPLLSLQRMRTHCWPQSLSPYPSSRGWVPISDPESSVNLCC